MVLYLFYFLGCKLLDDSGSVIDDNAYRFPLNYWSASDSLLENQEAFVIKSNTKVVIKKFGKICLLRV